MSHVSSLTMSQVSPCLKSHHVSSLIMSQVSHISSRLVCPDDGRHCLTLLFVERVVDDGSVGQRYFPCFVILERERVFPPVFNQRLFCLTFQWDLVVELVNSVREVLPGMCPS